MYKITFFVPLTHKEAVKIKMFESGAGKISNYDCCSFEVIGTGQFRALDGSKPFIGNQNILETVE